MDFARNKQEIDIVKAAREFAQKEFPNVAESCDRNEEFSPGLWRKACELGFVGVFVDEEYGGAGYGFQEHGLIAEEFCAADGGLGAAILANTFAGALLHLFGTKEQKARFLPPLVSGETTLALAIPESGAGSDVLGLSTAAVKDGDGWVVRGEKAHVFGGHAAESLLVLALTNPGSSGKDRRYSFLLVPTDGPGIETRKMKGKLGMRAAETAQVAFSGARVPADHLVGKEGEGFQELLDLYVILYATIGAMGVGISRAAYEEGLRYTKQRLAFGVPIFSLPATKAKLEAMATMIRAARHLCCEAAWSVDRGVKDASLSAMAKQYAAQTAVFCADEALQMHGGYGYFEEYRIQRLYRDAKVIEMWGGGKEIDETMMSNALR